MASTSIAATAAASTSTTVFSTRPCSATAASAPRARRTLKASFLPMAPLPIIFAPLSELKAEAVADAVLAGEEAPTPPPLCFSGKFSLAASFPRYLMAAVSKAFVASSSVSKVPRGSTFPLTEICACHFFPPEAVTSPVYPLLLGASFGFLAIQRRYACFASASESYGPMYLTFPSTTKSARNWPVSWATP